MRLNLVQNYTITLATISAVNKLIQLPKACPKKAYSKIVLLCVFQLIYKDIKSISLQLTTYLAPLSILVSVP
jgi:hypothetical protein